MNIKALDLNKTVHSSFLSLPFSLSVPATRLQPHLRRDPADPGLGEGGGRGGGAGGGRHLPGVGRGLQGGRHALQAPPHRRRAPDRGRGER